MLAMEKAAVLFFIICCTHATSAVAGNSLPSPRKSFSSLSAPSEDLKVEGVRYQVCADVGGVIYYCPGDTICCTPGSPSSKCCPEDHPLCIDDEYCCPEGYPKVCGEYCCTSDSYCCDDEFCCASEDQCCGPDECCLEQAPCCTGPDEKTCCDKDEMACCGSLYGCVAPCECPFDAIGCNIEANGRMKVGGPPPVTCPHPSESNVIYRILRPDEDCDNGLIAKDPSAARTVLSHVNCGSRKGYTSQYISFSSSMEVANYYRNKYGPTLRIAIIEVGTIPSGCQMIDLTSEAVRDQYLGNAVCKNFAKASCEVLLSCGTARVPCTYSNAERINQSIHDSSEL